MTSRRLKWLPVAERNLESLPISVQIESIEIAEALIDDPFPDGSLAMSERGAGYHRIHVGPGHRMVYKVTSQFIIIVRVDDRGGVYSGFEPL